MKKRILINQSAVESLFATIKREAFPTGCVFDSKSEALLTIFEYLGTFYNWERIRPSPGNQALESVLTSHFQTSPITLNIN